MRKKTTQCVLIISFLIGSKILADELDDPGIGQNQNLIKLSAPKENLEDTPVVSSQVNPGAADQSVTSPDVEKETDQTPSGVSITGNPTPLSSPIILTFTPTPDLSIKPLSTPLTILSSPTATSPTIPVKGLISPTSSSTLTISRILPSVTTIPNPAWGDKMIFRVMTQGPGLAHIRVFNRFMDEVARLDKKGDRLFDIIWKLESIPEGIYYYEAIIEDNTTGQIIKIPVQKFAVLKSGDERDN